jgi:hypothetical protein
MLALLIATTYPNSHFCEKICSIFIGYAELMNPQRLKESGASLVFTEMRLLPELIADYN